MRQIARLFYGIAEKFFYLGRAGSQLLQSSFVQFISKRCNRATDCRQELTKTVVQIAPDSLLFVFADLDDLLFEPLRMLQE